MSFITWKILVFNTLILHLPVLVKSEILTSPLVTNWGDWGEFQHCPNGTFVIGFQLKTEPWSWLGPLYDDTCLNAIRFYCGSPKVHENRTDSISTIFNSSNSSQLHGITSSEGYWGKWGRIYECNGDGYAIGFTLRSEEANTTWFDDTAANNLRILCSSSTTGFIEGDGERWGQWTSPRICPANKYICGLQTQVQKPQGIFGDDTALNNIRVECCSLES